MFFIASTFKKSLAGLPAQEQAAAKRAAFDFQMNPANPGLSYERLDRLKDSSFWSARVNDDIRLIVHRSGEQVTLCYVGHHDEAYRWAQHRRFETHPATGAAQFVEIVERTEEIVKRVLRTESAEPPIFRHFGRDSLLALGVPEVWLDTVAMATEDTLLQILQHLPEEAADRLLDLATGARPTDPGAKSADPFMHPDAQRRFRKVESEDELKESFEKNWPQGSLVPDARGVQRGTRLFSYLVEAANAGRALGISYGGFIAYLHAVATFDELTGRHYRPSDTGAIVRIALNITSAAGGRKAVARSQYTVLAGMDTFIWQKRKPFDRSPLAWKNSPVQPPYDRELWLRVFPNESRALIGPSEILRVA